MASAVQSNVYSFNEGSFNNFIRDVELIPNGYVLQDYLTLACVITREITPVITKKAQVEMQGDVLSSEFTQSKVFRDQIHLLHPILDPINVSILNSTDAVLKQSILATRTEEKTNSLVKVMLLTFRVDRDLLALSFFCQGAVQELRALQASMPGPCHIFAQIVMSESPDFSCPTDAAVTSPEDLIAHTLQGNEQLVNALEPKKGVSLESHFDCGTIDRTTVTLESKLEDGVQTIGQRRETDISSFFDVRVESTAEISFPPEEESINTQA